MSAKREKVYERAEYIMASRRQVSRSMVIGVSLIWDKAKGMESKRSLRELRSSRILDCLTFTRISDSTLL